MNSPITISVDAGIPKYRQISNSIIERINNGELKKGTKLPSINQICAENNLARETVVKAFSMLRQRGLITSIQGKGFYISSTDTNTSRRIFILFDTFTSYKETLYFGIKDAFGKDAYLDIYFHHFNDKVFSQLIKMHVGYYNAYIILPMNNRQISTSLRLIPKEQLYLIDVRPGFLKSDYVGIYQDFENDMIETLGTILPLIRKYRSLTLVFRNTITQVPVPLKSGFEHFCLSQGIKYRVLIERIGSEVNQGEGYIVIDDEDLVQLVEAANERHFTIGSDVGIISYNDTPLKKVAGNGISVISTDFRSMGCGIAKMIMQNERQSIRNKTTFVDRGSF